MAGHQVVIKYILFVIVTTLIVLASGERTYMVQSSAQNGFELCGQFETEFLNETKYISNIRSSTRQGRTRELSNDNGNNDGPIRKRKTPVPTMNPSKHWREDIRELVDFGSLGRFPTKLMFRDEIFTKNVNTFAQLTEDTHRLRKFLVELNCLLFKENVLPMSINSRDTFEQWTSKVTKRAKTLTLVDAQLADIQADIVAQKEFKDYEAIVKTVKNGATLKNNLFTTKERYAITEIVLSMDGPNLIVTLGRLEARLTLGMRSDQVHHYYASVRENQENNVINRGTLEENINFVDVERSTGEIITRITGPKLRKNENATLEFWQKLFEVTDVELVGYKGPLNEHANRFGKVGDKFLKDWEEIIRPTADRQKEVIKDLPGGCDTLRGGQVPTKCAFIIDEEGGVTSIHPEEFMEIYEISGAEGRRRMTDMVKNNRDKFVINDEANLAAASQRFNQLVHHEEMTTHAESVQKTGTIQDLSRWAGPLPETPSEVLNVIHETVAPRADRVRLSPSKVIYAIAKIPEIIEIEIPDKRFDHGMLAKGPITGIKTGDTNALAVFGGHYGPKGLFWVGNKLAWKLTSAGTKTGIAARLLGKLGGPIGSVLDVGFGAWSLSKSVDRYRKAENKYDRDDAIADIVSDTVGIAVDLAVAVLVLAGPIAAPFVIAAGIVFSIFKFFATSYFHASNAVAKINSQIPLLDFEKSKEFDSRFMDFFGLREKDYIDYLVDEKNLNDAAVKYKLEFLKKNKQFLGVVFPSRSLAYDGGCYLKRTYGCLLNPDLGTWSCLYSEMLGEGCDLHGPCGKQGQICRNETAADIFQCICEKKASTEFGVAHRDSDVDFRKKQDVFWERAVPGDDKDAKFKCKPSSVKYLDYRIHQRESRNEYHCRHAIGLYRPSLEQKPDQSFLVDLEDGKDTLVTDQKLDTTRYTFLLGEEGDKTFYGGAERNDFILNGNCSSNLLSGTLYGGPKDTDTLVIEPTCAKGETIRVERHSIRSRVSSNQLDLELERIENFIGRPNEAEVIDADCTTRLVMLNGGSGPNRRDSVYIGPDSCSVNVQVLMGNYTYFKSRARIGEPTVHVGADMVGSEMNVIEESNDMGAFRKTSVIFSQLNAEQVVIDPIKLGRYEVVLKLTDSTSRDPFTVTFSDNHKRPNWVGGKWVWPAWKFVQHQLFFNESSEDNPNAFSTLLVPGNDVASKQYPPMFFHDLQFHFGRQLTRIGSSYVSNLFNVSGNWNVRGGDQNDTFLLNLPISWVQIHGGSGHDTLMLANPESNVIDMDKNVQLQEIESVVKGDNAGPVEISTGCSLKEVVVKGDNSSTPDIVRLNHCKFQSLQVDAGGKTRVLVEEDIKEENQQVRVVAHATNQSPMMFEMDADGNHISKLFIQIELGGDFSRGSMVVKDGVRSSDGGSFQVQLTNRGSSYAVLKNLRLDRTTKDDESPYISTPHIQLVSTMSTAPSQLVFHRDTLKPLAVHVLEEIQRTGNVIGLKNVKNLFQILSGYWNVTGGMVGDTYICDTRALTHYRLKVNHDPEEGENTLVLKDYYPTLDLLHVNLQDGFAKFVNTYSETGTIEGAIHHLIGRTNVPDWVTVNCATRSVALGGGLTQDKPDTVTVPDMECENRLAMEVHLEQFTKVENFAKTGEFKYFVNLTEPSVTNPFSLNPTKDNMHKVVFTDTPAFKSITFDKTTKNLTFTMPEGAGHQYDFPLFRENDTGEYTNPEFLITSSSASSIAYLNTVITSVKVSEDDTTIATTLLNGNCSKENTFELRKPLVVRGIPVQVNNFLVKLSGPDGYSGLCGEITGHQDSVTNRFWLYSLPRANGLHINGPEVTSGSTTNELIIRSDFLPGKPITVNLSQKRQYLRREKGSVDVMLRRINAVQGRDNPHSYDTVIPSCQTKQVSGVDLVNILVSSREDCSYNLVIGVKPWTRVQFGWLENMMANENGTAHLAKFRNSTFHYRMAEPMSFGVVQSYPGMLDGTVHNYYLPFSFQDLTSLYFDEEENKLRYGVYGEEFWIEMVSQPGIQDQFYPQPNLVTKDEFSLQVGRDSSVLVTVYLKTCEAPREVMKRYQALTRTLGVTMLISTPTAIFYLGHGGEISDRNVLQNVAYTTSYLGGGGAADTIYEVVSLKANVYIDTGLTNDSILPAVNTEGPYITKQTLDLTDVVAPIRHKSGKKYKPVVAQRGDDLVLTMEGYQTEHPGEIVIFDGVNEITRSNFQILLHHSMMEVRPSGMSGPTTAWELAPVDIHLQREKVYSLASEDLEYGHHVTVLDHEYGPEYQFRFNYSRNGGDLHLSDVADFVDHKYDQQHIEMTTVIITDFYKQKNQTGQDAENTTTASLAELTEMRDVTLTIPGLTIRLDGTQVVVVSQTEHQCSAAANIVSPNTNLSSSVVAKRAAISADPQMSCSLPVPGPLLLSEEKVPNWLAVLHVTEEAILEKLPFVPRLF